MIGFVIAGSNLSSADHPCKQFGPRSGQIRSGFNLFETLIVLMLERFFVLLKKVDLNTNLQTRKD